MMPGRTARVAGTLAEEVINNGGLLGMCELSYRAPRLTRRLNRFAARTSSRRFSAPSTPTAPTPPSPSRCARRPPDDVALSTAYQRPSCYIAAHRYHKEPYREYFALLEPIFQEAGGRPHWGKLHTLGQADLRERYPLFDEVARLRARLDPQGVFLTPYLAGLFGA